MEQHLDVVATGTEFRFIPKLSKEDLPITHEIIILSFLKGYYAILYSSLLIRTHVIQEIGGYNEFYKFASDYDLISRLSFVGKIENLSEALMKYRKHDLQISQHYHKEQVQYAEVIRENFQLNFINSYKEVYQHPVNRLHVSHFQMGAAIAYFTYARKTRLDTYETFANHILEQALASMSMGLPVCLHNGICGIGCGLIYLLRNNFIEGNENEVLEEIDNIVFTNLYTNEENRTYRQDQQDYTEYRKSKNMLFINSKKM